MSVEKDALARRGSHLTRGMKVVLIIVALIVLAGVIAAIALASSGSGGGRSDGQGTSAASSSTTAATPPEASFAPTEPGPIPGATPTSGSEVQPPRATPRTALPPLKTTAPLMEAPLPKSGTKNGGLVTGFPTKLMGPGKGSQVLTTSIATEGTTAQITLVAITSANDAETFAHYESLWSELGLQRVASEGGGLTFTGPHESMTLATEKSGTGNRYTIYGVFRTK
jgi:hypothetical protein